jgi:tetratricopeptide (TPR) repeat protein
MHCISLPSCFTVEDVKIGNGMEGLSINENVVLEPEVVLKRYDMALSAIEAATPDFTAAQVLETLLARDALRTALADTQLEPCRHMAQLIELDRRLQQQAEAIAKAMPLEAWCNSRQPAEDAWWWLFQPQLEPESWNRFDWLWNGLTAGALALAASFMVGIYQALSVGGLSWSETFSTIAQGAGLALVGQGALTTAGQQKVKTVLACLKISPRFYSKVTCVFAMFFLLIVFGLHRYLPNYFYAKGQALYEQGHLTDAEERYTQGQRIEPSDPRFNIALGKVYESLGSLDQALTQYQQALQQGVTRAFNDIGRVYVQRFDPVKKRTEPLVAETYLRMGLQRAESDPNTDINTRFQLHRNLGWALIAQKRYAEAQVELEKASAEDAQIAEKQIGGGMESCFLAQAYAQQGDSQNALAHWNLCRAHARPETLNEYKWFLSIGQPQLANCIDTSSIVSGLAQPPSDFNATCRGPIAKLISTDVAASTAPLEALRVGLHDRLNQYWRGSAQVQQDLVYRVSVAPNGTITAYEALNQPASEYVQSTPLPALTGKGESTAPLANFKVVLRPAGAFHVSLLD